MNGDFPKRESPLPEENVVSVTGCIVEAGHIDMGLRHGDPKAIGVTLECGARDIRITGLDRDEARAFAKRIGEEVTLRIAEVRKP